MPLQPDKTRLQELANKMLKGSISEREQAEFDEWFNVEVNSSFDVPENFAMFEDEHRRLILSRIHDKIDRETNTGSFKLWYRIAAAAVVLVFISIGSYWLLNRPTQFQVALQQFKGVKAGGNKAMLTLANGHQIVLTDVHNGAVASQGKVRVYKIANGQLAYKANNSILQNNSRAPLFNTVTTPNGGQYEVALPDGSHVWLNAASSLKFPVAFTTNERSVELTGEAYFEITPNKHLPFRVQSGGQTVEVLGTHFNVDAYTDELSVKTTLLEGSVKISAGQNNAPGFLRPGQRSVYNRATSTIQVNDADTALAVAWKHGLFSFREADIASIMRTWGRWYNVRVEIQGELPTRKFSGKIYRNVNAAQALEILGDADIHYKIEKSQAANVPDKLIITP